jgi:hypothetical protein
MQVARREIVTYAANGGTPCDSALSKVQECGRDPCPGPAPEDCKFGEWQEWGMCGKCNGERMRYRQILQYAKNGGRNCEQGDAAEVGECPRNCDTKMYCSWSEWQQWSVCSVQCGEGKRTRRRDLYMAPVKADSPADASALERSTKYQDLYERTRALEQGHTQELVLAFVAGFFCFVVGLFGVRVVSSTRSTSARAQYTEVSAGTGNREVWDPLDYAAADQAPLNAEGQANIQLTQVA